MKEKLKLADPHGKIKTVMPGGDFYGTGVRNKTARPANLTKVPSIKKIGAKKT